MKCYRCGKEGHFGKDPCCPAKGNMCSKCGKIEKANMCIMLKLIQMMNMHSLENKEIQR